MSVESLQTSGLRSGTGPRETTPLPHRWVSTVYRYRLPLILLWYGVVFVALFGLSMLLRFDGSIPDRFSSTFWRQAIPLALLQLAAYARFSHLKASWRYVSFMDLLGLLKAAAVGLAAVLIASRITRFGDEWPRSVFLINFCLQIVVVGASRSGWRLLRESYRHWSSSDSANRVLLVSDERNASCLLPMLRSQREVAGIVTLSEGVQGLTIHGIPVVGTTDEIVRIAFDYCVRDVLVVDGMISGNRMRRFMSQCDGVGLAIRIIPSFNSLLENQAVRRLSSRDVGIQDLLRRDEVKIDSTSIEEMIRGKRLLLTGAGGSIGSEICRQLLRYEPEELVLVERFEGNLFEIERELRQIGASTMIRACIADVTDTTRMHRLFGQHRPQVVFHTAAHKHVPLMESNLGEACKNNVFGTQLVARCAHQYGAEAFVLVSTDKAVSPSSVMGATKRLCERYVRHLSQTSKTRFVTVRFGNVLGSAGSVIPIFQEQIRRGGPLTITHPEMTRFFMTIPEASLLVLQAAALGTGGEIFVLDMGQPVRIVDLATDLIHLSGYSTAEIPIVYTGVRPGEKLHEELTSQQELSIPSRHPRIRVVVTESSDSEEIEQVLDRLKRVVDKGDMLVAKVLREALPGFAPSVETLAPAAVVRGQILAEQSEAALPVADASGARNRVGGFFAHVARDAAPPVEDRLP